MKTRILQLLTGILTLLICLFVYYTWFRKSESIKTDITNYEYLIDPIRSKSTRVCYALDLIPNQDTIAKYKFYHSSKGFLKEIGEGLKRAGITAMEIYNIDNRLFMIVEVPADKDFNKVWNETGKYENQDEWDKLMTGFQKALPGHQFGWIKLERVFNLSSQ